MTRFRGETERHEFSASKGHKHAHDDKGSSAPKSQRVDDTPDFSKRDNREEKTKSIVSTDGDYHFLSAGTGGDDSAGPPSKGGGKGGGKGGKEGGKEGKEGGGKGGKGGKEGGGKDWGDADKDGMPNKIDKAPKNPTKK